MGAYRSDRACVSLVALLSYLLYTYMCGTVAPSACGLDFGRKDTFIGGRLRKTRSLQDLKGEIILGESRA